MKRRWLVLVVALVFARPLCGQLSVYSPQNAEWEVTGFVGHSFGDKFEFPTKVIGSDLESSRTVGMRFDGGYMLGVRIDQNIEDHLDTGLEYSFANQWLRFTHLSPTIETLSLNSYIHNFSYKVSYLPLPRSSRFRPYVDAGTGLALFYIPGRVKKDALELGIFMRDSWQWTFHFGGGLKYLVTDGFALSVDFKDRMSRVPSYGLPDSTRVVDGIYQPGFHPHGVLNLPQLSFGVTYQWDEP